MTISVAGERLLPPLVDEIANNEPDRVLYSIAKTKNPADGFQDISAKVFARAVDRCAWHIEKNLGRGQGFPTLTYMGPQDVVYAIAILACIKTSYKLLLNSPRNTLEAHLSLFEKTDCNVFLLPPNLPLPAVKQILAAREMRVLEIPSLQHWLQEGHYEPYPYRKTFAEAKSDPFVVLHTSGSTGLPKPIVQTHGTVTASDAFTTLPSLGLQPTYPAMCAGSRVYLAFPLFHGAGILMLLPGSIFVGFTIVLGPFPPSADVADAVHVHGNVQHSCLAPMTLIDLVKDPKHLENLRHLKQVTFGGGPCPRGVGDLVSSKTRLLNCLGTTECGILPVQLCDPEDWSYISLSPVLGHEYRHVSGDLYEQVIVRDPKLRHYQAIFETFPELTEWPMKDLYSKHPIKKDLWLYRGRADDIVVFSTGEKLNPFEMESIITAHQAVSASIITGLGRTQSSLLVEAVTPPSNEEEAFGLLEALWPSVEAANKLSPSHGRIHRNMIRFTSANKPMLRAGKGTVQRKLTVDLYRPELDALYEANGTLGNENAGFSSPGIDIVMNGRDSIQDAIRHIVAASTDIDVLQVSPEADLFELGLDSLQVALMTRRINELLLLHNKPRSMDTSIVYSNPSVAQLTAAVEALAEGTIRLRSPESSEQKMQRLYSLHATNMPISARKAQPWPQNHFVVLLTGSTGSVGSYVLESLVKDTRVSHIYCLNRGPDSLDRQRKSQAAKDLRPIGQKVTCLDADFSKPYFGLSTQQYRTILEEVTTIIHNAWQVDFNLSVDSFASQIATVRRFIDFSAHSTFGARLVFISSVGAVSGRSGRVPEEPYEDPHTPQAMGYAQSKFVAERLLSTAAIEAGIPTAIIRLGQVAGPTATTGIWPKQEWLPSLIASSKYLGKIPASLGRMDAVDWVPVDIIGQSIVELAVNAVDAHNTSMVYHLVNPQRTVWEKLVPSVRRSLGTVEEVEAVSLETWMQALRESTSRVQDITQNPAVKILPFFEALESGGSELVSLDTTKSVALSPTLANAGPIQEELMDNWMRQWMF